MAHPEGLIFGGLHSLSKQLIPDALRKRIGRVLRATFPFGPFGRNRAIEREDELLGWFNRATGDLLPGFPITEKDTVLDVGCGPGSASLFAASRGAEVLAVDIDPDVVKSIRAQLKKSPARRSEAHETDSNPLPIAAGRATRILAQEVMEHVDDPRAFLAELYRVGAPGALYLISVPDPVSEDLLREFVPDLCWQKPYHIHVYGREEFGELVEGAGLEIVHRQSWGFYWSMWWVFMWGTEGKFEFGSSKAATLYHWNKAWDALLRTERGLKVRKALEAFMPKSQIIIARKPG